MSRFRRYRIGDRVFVNGGGDVKTVGFVLERMKTNNDCFYLVVYEKRNRELYFLECGWHSERQLVYRGRVKLEDWYPQLLTSDNSHVRSAIRKKVQRDGKA